MDRLFRTLLNIIIRRGTLRVTTAAGTIFMVGDGSGQDIAIRFTSPLGQIATLLDPELKVGEAYMNGTLAVEQGSIADLLALVLSQDDHGEPPRWARPLHLVRYWWRRLQQLNRPGRARRNVAHHYDLDGRLYSLFLDADRQYSCGYFESPDASLDDAQLAKKRHLAAKLLVPPDCRVLDIGSGWGGLALYLAETCEARVTGVTLSDEQHAASRRRAEEKDLTHRAEFRLQDYRDIAERYDRIVSVGMFEHVGVGFYDAYFRKCAELLADDGVMVLHSIGRSEGPNVTNPFISKYIFPGGYIPALSEVLPAVERAGLLVTDIEILRLHYSETLRTWRERFLAHREQVERLYDQRFVRMWEFYLASSEMSFRYGGLMVLQVQLAKRTGVVPITRDYIAREEARLRVREGGTRAPLRLAGE
jgi:cyclopropane-fatty-acyl-phospholipid synthase